jgi:sec-independent protein translocase protein TatA
MGAMEIVIIFLIYLLFFGAKGIPNLARTLGKGMRQFREATGDIQREIMDSANDIKKQVDVTRDDPPKSQENS